MSFQEGVSKLYVKDFYEGIRSLLTSIPRSN